MEISILITAYNVTNYIEECLDSVHNQTYFKDSNYEILLGIDGCIKTLGKVKSIKDKYKNLKVLYMPENKGTYITTNTLLYEAKGEYILRFDSDDLMKPEMVESMIRELKELKEKQAIWMTPRFSEFLNKIEESSGILSGADGVILVNRELLIKEFGGWSPWICGADSDLIHRFWRAKKGGYKTSEVLFYRRVHPTQLTRDSKTNFYSPIRKNVMKMLQENKINNIIYVSPVVNEFKEIL